MVAKDVEQAHLSFHRHGDSMPCLRRLVRPLDWGSLRERLVSLARDPEKELWTTMRLQDGKRCLEAGQVKVSTFSSSGRCKLCPGRLNIGQRMLNDAKCIGDVGYIMRTIGRTGSKGGA